MAMHILLVLLFLTLLAVAQQAPPNPQSVVINVAPQPMTMTPPPVTLQQALQIAENYIAESKIDIGRYWLQEARWVLPKGATAMKESHWFLFWNNLGTGSGDYVQIEVDMDRPGASRSSA